MNLRLGEIGPVAGFIVQVKTLAADWGAIGNGATKTVTKAIAGAVAGDFVVVQPVGTPAAGLVFLSGVSDNAGNVALSIYNPTGAPINQGDLTLEALVLRPDVFRQS